MGTGSETLIRQVWPARRAVFTGSKRIILSNIRNLRLGRECIFCGISMYSVAVRIQRHNSQSGRSGDKDRDLCDPDIRN